MTWARLIAGQSGARQIESFDVSRPAGQIACAGSARRRLDGTFNPDDWMEPKDQRKVDDFIVFGWRPRRRRCRTPAGSPKTYEDQIATGVLIGSGIGGLGGIYEASIIAEGEGPARASRRSSSPAA